MKVNVAKSASAKATLVHYFFKKSKDGSVQFCTCCPKELRDDISRQIKENALKNQMGSMVFYRNFSGKNHLYIGLGVISDLSYEKLRRLASKLYKKAKAENLTELSVPVDQIPGKWDSGELVTAMTEGFCLSAYTFDDFKAKANPDKMTVTLTHKNPSAALTRKAKEAETVSDCMNFSRWLGDCPGNFMNPTRLAEETKKAAKGSGLKVTVWDKARIKKERMESLLGVAAGSDQDPRFIIMEYNGAAKSKKPICYVGKGLTFDAGGISLKPSPGMEEMKYDMCGGASVIGAVLAIARLKLKVNVIAYVPASENMPGPSANKPGDIRKARNGKSIEINNTDAEGRLILADALSYATEKKPAWIAEAATLTGAMMIALGRTHTGFYTKNNKLRDLVNKSAEQCGELVWQMPLTEDHSNDMKGTYADLSNIGPHKFAGSAQAAAFLENFVGEDIPWVHCDVAGTAWHVGKYFPYHPARGASGSMVRTFVNMARNHK